MAGNVEKVSCPICHETFSLGEINQHVDGCLDDGKSSTECVMLDYDIDSSGSASKKRRVDVDNKLELKSENFFQKNLKQSTLNSKQTSLNFNSESMKRKKVFPSKCLNDVESRDIRLPVSPTKSERVSLSKSILCANSNDIYGNFKPIEQSNSLKKSEKIVVEDTSTKPLAEQMRPLNLDDYIGQRKVVGCGTLLRSLIEANKIPSMIFWGPPGCGKTTLAKVIATTAKSSKNSRFVQLSATTSGVADVKKAIEVAKNEYKMFKKQTVLFFDEIHRFNKLQQDSFLPHVEDGTIILIGATTENPSFQINNALLSRCRVIVLEELSIENLETIIRKALDRLGIMVQNENDKSVCDRKRDRFYMTEEALHALAGLCSGDARIALNCLQTVYESKKAKYSQLGAKNEGTKEHIVICISDIREILQKSSVLYDRNGDQHYFLASALQKSIRGSDANAALYYMARMMEGGEDPKFIARRLVVCASEDIGLADPNALVQAATTMQVCQMVGAPECGINLAQCVVYLARAPKSIESYAAFCKAKQLINSCEGPQPPIPLHLRNASTKLQKQFGYGKGYQYNPRAEGSVKQTYLPDSLIGTNFFEDKPR